MPLSENEQRLLEQMERALYAEDPKFASAMRGANRRPGAGRRLLLGGVSIVLGLVVLVFGVSQKQVLLGVLGFVLMLGGTAYAVSSQRRSGPVGVVNAAGVRPAAKGRKRPSGSFMQRLEERWDRRRDSRLKSQRRPRPPRAAAPTRPCRRQPPARVVRGPRPRRRPKPAVAAIPRLRRQPCRPPRPSRHRERDAAGDRPHVARELRRRLGRRRWGRPRSAARTWRSPGR